MNICNILYPAVPNKYMFETNAFYYSHTETNFPDLYLQ